MSKVEIVSRFKQNLRKMFANLSVFITNNFCVKCMNKMEKSVLFCLVVVWFFSIVSAINFILTEFPNP